ncbi:MAG: LysE family translocator [Mycobacteriales bacterium]
MPSAARLALFVPAALALLLLPGPAVMYVVARSLQQGRRAGLISVAGIHTATLVHIAAAAAGLSAVLLRSAVLFSAVKYAGAAYLVVLGLAALRADRRTVASGPDPSIRPRRRLYAQGFVVNVLNPKTALFFLAFLPQFVDADGGHPALQITVFGITFLVLGVLTDSAYAVLAARIGARFSGDARLQRRQRRASGGVLIGLGVVAGLTPSTQ